MFNLKIPGFKFMIGIDSLKPIIVFTKDSRQSPQKFIWTFETTIVYKFVFLTSKGIDKVT